MVSALLVTLFCCIQRAAVSFGNTVSKERRRNVLQRADAFSLKGLWKAARVYVGVNSHGLWGSLQQSNL